MRARGDAWIDRLELHVASRACEIFGLLLARGPDGKLSGHGEAEWARFGQLGFDVFRRGADVVTNELAQILSRPGVDGRSFSRVYGPFTTWLNGRGLGEEFEPLRDVVQRQIFSSFNVRRGILVLGKPSPGVGQPGNAELPSLDGLSEGLRRLMQQRGLISQEGDGIPRPKGFVTLAMVGSVRREYDDLVDSISAAGMLGLTQEELRAQVDADTLCRRMATSSGRDLFDRTVLRAWRGHRSAQGQAATALYGSCDDRADMSVAEAADRLKVTAKTIFYLIDHGFLGAARGSRALRAGSAGVNAVALAAFEDIFVSLGHLAVATRAPQGALAIRPRSC